jgi:hypothetical protein
MQITITYPIRAGRITATVSRRLLCSVMADDLESQVVPSPVVDTANIAQEDSENPNKSKDPAHAEEDRYAHHRALARAAQRRFRKSSHRYCRIREY